MGLTPSARCRSSRSSPWNCARSAALYSLAGKLVCACSPCNARLTLHGQRQRHSQAEEWTRAGRMPRLHAVQRSAVPDPRYAWQGERTRRVTITRRRELGRGRAEQISVERVRAQVLLEQGTASKPQPHKSPISYRPT
jgi:hypothetical protein